MRKIDGSRGQVVVHEWVPVGEPSFVALLAHGYAEHAGRHAELAERLEQDGAAVYAPDHWGHGYSGGDRALIDDPDALLEDFSRVYEIAVAEHPDLPVLLIGHSMGGLLATLFLQEAGRPVDAVVLSSPLLGGNPGLEALLELEEIPEIPIDPSVISRDELAQDAYLNDELVYHGPFQRLTLEGLVDVVSRAQEGGGFGDQPLLWIHGTGDMLVPFDLTRDAVENLAGPGTEKKTYADARHELFHETNKDEVYKDVFDFIHRKIKRQ
ncbi:MAG: lysophospholipase [Solirubrobacterales bacterium]|nr:lysophospholipase [Solirubrobacterales bacterium]